MSRTSKRRPPDRYEVSGNTEAQFADRAGKVLLNKKGIRGLKALQHREEDALAAAYDRLSRDVRTDTPITCDLIRLVHERIFGGLFDWAGRWRTVKISKPGAVWPPPYYLE